MSLEFWKELWNFVVWAVPTILTGFVPMMIAFFVARLKSEDQFLMRDFYFDGGLLFLGAALLGALFGDLRNRGVLFGNDILSTFTLTVIFCVLLIATVVYTFIRTNEAKKTQNPYLESFVAEISWGVTGASAIYVMCVTAVHAFQSSVEQ